MLSRSLYHQTRFIFFAWLVAHLKSLLTCFLSTPGRLAAFSSGASRIHFHSAYILYRHGSRFCGARLLYSPHQSSVLVLFPTVCAWFSYRLRFFNAFGLKRHAYFLLLSHLHRYKNGRTMVSHGNQTSLRFFLEPAPSYFTHEGFLLLTHEFVLLLFCVHSPFLRAWAAGGGSC